MLNEYAKIAKSHAIFKNIILSRGWPIIQNYRERKEKYGFTSKKE